MDLQQIRAEIDKIDKELVHLFQERMKISEKVARYKIANGKAVFDEAREAQKIQSVRGLADTDFNKDGAERLFALIMEISRERQYQLLEEQGIRDGEEGR